MPEDATGHELRPRNLPGTQSLSIETGSVQTVVRRLHSQMVEIGFKCGTAEDVQREVNRLVSRTGLSVEAVCGLLDSGLDEGSLLRRALQFTKNG